MDEQKRTRERTSWMFPLGTVGRDMIYTPVYEFHFDLHPVYPQPDSSAAFRSHSQIMVAARCSTR